MVSKSFLIIVVELIEFTICEGNKYVKSPKLQILSPRQPLESENGRKYIDVDSGSLIHLRCDGSAPINWTTPVEGGVLFNNCDEGANCSSEFIINNSSYEQTGLYSCFYKNQHDDDESVLLPDNIYIFINDEKYLIVRNDFDRIIVVLPETEGATIPCKPTNSKANVSLVEHDNQKEVKVGQNFGVEYNRMTGFTFRNPEGKTNYFICNAALNNVSEKVHVHIFWLPDPPTVSNGFNPIISGDRNKRTVVNENLFLKCEVEKKETETIFVSWIHPVTDTSRFEYKKINGNSIVVRELSIKHLQPEDTGFYVCKVNDEDDNVYSSAKFIIVSDTNQTSSHYCTFDLNNTEPLIAREGKNFHVVVSIDCTSEVKYLFWSKNGERIANVTHIENVQNRIHSFIYDEQVTLDIRKVTAGDNGKYALHVNGVREISNVSLALLVDGKPSVHINHSYYYAFDNNYSIICSVKAYPKPNMWWEINPCGHNESNCAQEKLWFNISNHLTNNNEFEVKYENDEKYGNYVIKLNTTAKQSASYRCCAVNRRGSACEELFFIVTDISEGALELTSSSDEPVKSDELVITCKATSFVYNKISWFRQSNGNENGNPSLFAVVNTSRLNVIERTTDFSIVSEIKFNDVSVEDNGNYYCNATNYMNPEKNISMNYVLKVTSAEPSKILSTNMNENEITTDLHATFSFYCYAIGKPTPKISWYKNGKELFGVETEEKGQKLIIPNVASDDSGHYECRVSNRVNNSTRTATLKVNSKATNTRNKDTGIIVVISIAVCVVGVTICVVTCVTLFIKRTSHNEERRRKKQQMITANETMTTNVAVHSHKINQSSQVYSKMFNPDIAMNEQVKFLSYDISQLEFPEENLKLGSFIGAGEFGYVFEAEAFEINGSDGFTTVAVKKSRNKESLNALMAEIKILGCLGKHPNIMNILGAVTNNPNNIMIIVEYCRHGNLRDYVIKNRDRFVDQFCVKTNYDFRQSLSFFKNSEGGVYNPIYQANLLISDDRNGNLNTADLVYFSCQVARGMQFLTERKYVHRDLAARNVLLADNNVVKICDFGLTKQCYKYVKQGIEKMPLKWLAIESIRDQEFTSKSDVWSFGVLMWELFALGVDPYPGKQADETLFRQLEKGYRMEKPEFCPNYVYSLMRQCWSDKPKGRPEFISLAYDLEHLLCAYSASKNYDDYEKMSAEEIKSFNSSETKEFYVNLSESQNNSQTSEQKERPIFLKSL